MQCNGEQQISAAVFGCLCEHLRGRQGGCFVYSHFAKSFRLRAARRRYDHGVERADPDVLAGDDQQPSPCRAWIVLVELAGRIEKRSGESPLRAAARYHYAL